MPTNEECVGENLPELAAMVATSVAQLLCNDETVHCTVLLHRGLGVNDTLYVGTTLRNSHELRGMLATAIAQSMVDEGIHMEELSALTPDALHPPAE